MYSRRRLKKILKKQGFSAAVDLTAMIDVVFILLIFFILTSNIAQNVFDLEIPKADESYTDERQSDNSLTEIKVTLFTSGEFAIGENKFQDYSAFKKDILKLYEKNSNTHFLVITESSLPVQNLMELLTFFKAAKITKIDILLRNQ